MSELDAAVGKALSMVWALLAPERTGVTLEEAPPDPAPEAIGALAGVGAVAPSCGVRLSAYVFDRWGGGQEQVEAIQARTDEQGPITRCALNGPLLLLGTADRGDPAEWVLNDLCSAFAGWE